MEKKKKLPNYRKYEGLKIFKTLLNYSTGNLSVLWGQNTGMNWNGTHIIFVSAGTIINNSGIPEVSFSGSSVQYIPSCKSGSEFTIILPVAKSYSLKMGQAINDTLWAKYTTPQNSTPQYAEIATINIKAS